jgi:hypothetical protein
MLHRGTRTAVFDPEPPPVLPSPCERARAAVLTVLDVADEFRADQGMLRFMADVMTEVLTGIQARLAPAA